MTAYLDLALPNEAATLALGGHLAVAGSGLLVRLRGELGAGKTTLARGWLRALGYRGAVKSPTYTIVEPYCLADGSELLHVDLYRLGAEHELDAIGFRDYLASGATCLVEWPERAERMLAGADLDIALTQRAEGRGARVAACSPRLRHWLRTSFDTGVSGVSLR